LLEFSKKKAALRLHQDMTRLNIPLLREGMKRDFHSLGSSTATSMDRHGIAPALASKTMRHKSWAQTEAYIKREAAEVRAVMQGLEDEIKHTDDTEGIPMDHVATSSAQTYTGGGVGVPHPPPSASPRSKLARFPRKKASAPKAPDLTWAAFKDFTTQIRHMLSKGESETLKAFFALSPSQRSALVRSSKVKSA